MLNFKIFEQFLSNHQNIMIISHENPDIDSISSTIALENLLTELKKKVISRQTGRLPNIINNLDYKNIIGQSLDKGIPEDLSSYSLIIVDTNDTNNIGIPPNILKEVRDILVIDHHSYKNGNFNNYLIDVGASSTCEIIYRLYREYNIELPPEVATAIYAGIVYDTGFFCYPKTSALTFEVAAELVKRGASPNDIYLLLNENESVGALKIHQAVLNTLELHCNDRIAVMTVTADMLKKAGAKYEETAELINIPLKSEKVKISVFIKESLNGKKKISLRSKGPLDMADIAFKYGGGGHRNSAGFKLRQEKDKIEPLKTELLAKLYTLFNQ